MAAFKQTFDEALTRRIAGLTLAAQRLAIGAEAEMKTRAAWRDRTGNARSGLYGGALATPNGATIQLGHGVEYGVHLEKLYAGRYAIVDRTADRLRASIPAMVREVFR
jgi:hypothetical protein